MSDWNFWVDRLIGQERTIGPAAVPTQTGWVIPNPPTPPGQPGFVNTPAVTVKRMLSRTRPRGGVWFLNIWVCCNPQELRSVVCCLKVKNKNNSTIIMCWEATKTHKPGLRGKKRLIREIQTCYEVQVFIYLFIHSNLTMVLELSGIKMDPPMLWSRWTSKLQIFYCLLEAMKTQAINTLICINPHNTGGGGGRGRLCSMLLIVNHTAHKFKASSPGSRNVTFSGL